MRTHGILLLGLALASASASAWSAPKSVAAEAQAQYQREQAVCRSGQSNQDRATCLKEAGAAYAEARRNGLGAAPDPGNVEQRCEALPAAQRSACMARMQGHGIATGSAAAGGIVREVEQPVAPAPAK